MPLMLLDVRHQRHSPALFGLPPDREAEAVLMVESDTGRSLWPPHVPPRDPASIDQSPFELPVEVNQGRWIVECPCGSAQLASRTDRRFYCVECGNALFEGMWVHVAWPAEAEALEAELLRRPFAANRNWRPDETTEEGEPVGLEALREETDVHMAALEVAKVLPKRMR